MPLGPTRSCSWQRNAPDYMISPLTNRSVVVTGGTGSFGRKFVRHALAVGATRVGVFSRGEFEQSRLAAELNDPRLRFMIGSVTDEERLVRAFTGVDIVVHAAALKQVPACEDNPWEAEQTNVEGTRKVAAAAITAGVQKAVLLSTDKAAAPSTLYGATKLTAERIWCRSNVYAAHSTTRLVATRYGNVLGSRGSVIPKWREQAAKEGVLTITEPGMTRFWMRLDQAIALVELAIREGRGGEVFVPKLPSASIQTLAKAVAPSARWDLIGLRGDEKRHELLISHDEAGRTFDCGDHYRIEPAKRSWESVTLPAVGTPVRHTFSYQTDTNFWQLDIDEMRKLIEEAGV